MNVTSSLHCTCIVLTSFNRQYLEMIKIFQSLLEKDRIFTLYMDVTGYIVDMKHMIQK